MATLYANDYRIEPALSAAKAGTVVVRPFTYNQGSGLNTGDAVYLARIPGSAGVILLGFVIDFPALDSGGGKTFVAEIGDSSAADRYVTTTLAGSVGQSAGRLASFFTGSAGAVLGSLPAKYAPSSGDDNLILTAQTGVNTAVLSAVIRGVMWYTYYGVVPAGAA